MNDGLSIPSKRHLARCIPALMLAVSVLTAASGARASFLEDDSICNELKGNGGCVVVHDGNSFNVFDGGDSIGNRIGKDEPLIFRNSNPIKGTGPVDMVITGTLTPAGVPGPGEGTLVAIDTDGDGSGDIAIDDSGSIGVLDAADRISAFAIDPSTDVVFDTTVVRHSFYVTSTTPFSITARAVLTNSPDGANSMITLDQVGYQIAVTESGTDDGMSFGGTAVQVNPKLTKGINTLADIAGTAVEIIEFPRGEGIRKRAAPDMPAQSVRVDFIYDVPAVYDLSLGTGRFGVDVEYNFIKK